MLKNKSNELQRIETIYAQSYNTRFVVVRLQGVKLYNYRVYACTTIGYDVVQFLRIATRLSRSAEPSDKAEEAILSYPESYAFLLEKRFLVIWFHMPLHLSCYNFVVIAKVRLFREQTSRSLLLPTEHPKHKDCWIIPWS